MFDLLKRLCETPAPSGCESRVSELIQAEIRPYVDSLETDALGNLIAHKKGNCQKLMLCAHMDEIGLVATCHGEKGQIYVSALGGVSPHRALYQRVQFMGGAEGVLVPDGEEETLLKDLKLRNLYVDIGAKDEKEAASRVAVGEAAVFGATFVEQGEVILSKALDNRTGCWALVEAIKGMKQQKNDLYFVFTVSEELGLRGAKAAAVSVRPDYAVALDVTLTGDTPSAGKMAVSLGKGVAVKIMDAGLLTHPIIKEKLISLCEKGEIPYQPEVLEKGRTDVGAIHLTGGGVPSGCISIPARYIHSSGEMVSKADLKAAFSLTKSLLDEGIE